MGALRDAVALLMGADRRRRSVVTRGEGLSHTHLRAMFLVLRQGEATAGDLARAADLNPASVTAMVNRLQRRGLVERRRHAEDRRVCLVALTRTGQAVVAAQERHTAARLHGLLEGISDDELLTAIRVLSRLTALVDDDAGGVLGLQDAPGPATSGPAGGCAGDGRW
jgi:MarR family transcriptional regulator, organic hydroperoxide resistance regulator